MDSNAIIIWSLLTLAVACIAIWLNFKKIQNQNMEDISVLKQHVLEIEEQKNEEISDLKKQILDIDNFLTCLIMIAYMNEAEARQSTENQNIMEHRSLMEDLVAMKMEYDNEKNSLE